MRVPERVYNPEIRWYIIINNIERKIHADKQTHLPPFLPPFFGAGFFLPVLVILLTSFATLNPVFFLLIMTLNLSRSVRLALVSDFAIFLAHEEAAHWSASFWSTAAFLYFQALYHLLNCFSSGTAEELQVNICERQSLQWVSNSREAGGWSINEHCVVVNDIYDHTNLAIILSVVNETRPSWLHIVFEDLTR